MKSVNLCSTRQEATYDDFPDCLHKLTMKRQVIFVHTCKQPDTRPPIQALMLKTKSIWGENFKELLALRQNALVTVRVFPLLVLLGRTWMRILPTTN